MSEGDEAKGARDKGSRALRELRSGQESTKPPEPAKKSRLIKCRDCKREVSVDAVRCPGCGREFRDETVTSALTRILFYVFNVVMVAPFLFSLGPYDPDTREVAEAWTIGAVIIGMFALVARGTTRERAKRTPKGVEPRSALYDADDTGAAGASGGIDFTPDD